MLILYHYNLLHLHSRGVLNKFKNIDSSRATTFPVAVCVKAIRAFHQDLSQAIISKFAEKPPVHFRNKDVELLHETTKWAGFPRKEQFYSRMIRLLEQISRSSLQTMTELLLNLLPASSVIYNTVINPSHSAIPAKEPQHGFDAFERLLNPEGRTERWTHNWKDWDLLECIVTMVVGDALANCLRHYDGQNLTPEIAQRCIEASFAIFKFSKGKAHNEKGWNTVWTALREDVVLQWAVVLYRLTPYQLNAVIPQFVKRVDPSTKPSDEDVDLCFKGMRYIRINVSRSVYCFFCI